MLPESRAAILCAVGHVIAALVDLGRVADQDAGLVMQSQADLLASAHDLLNTLAAPAAPPPPPAPTPAAATRRAR